MLAEWLEKEAQGDMVKTAAQQFEDELSALDAPSIAKVWREAKTKEAQVGQRLLQAVPGAVGGGILGAGLGAAGGAVMAPSGQRLDAAGRGALLGGAIGAGGGALSGASVNPARMAGLNDFRRQAIEEIAGGVSRGGGRRAAKSLEAMTQPRSGVEMAGSALGSLGTAGALGAGLVEGGKRRKKGEKEKKSSVDVLKLALMKKAGVRPFDREPVEKQARAKWRAVLEAGGEGAKKLRRAGAWTQGKSMHMPGPREYVKGAVKRLSESPIRKMRIAEAAKGGPLNPPGGEKQVFRGMRKLRGKSGVRSRTFMSQKRQRLDK